MAIIGNQPENTRFYHFCSRYSTYQVQSVGRNGEVKPNEFASALAEAEPNTVLFICNDTPELQEKWFKDSSHYKKKEDMINRSRHLERQAKVVLQVPDLPAYEMWAHACTGEPLHLLGEDGVFLTKQCMYVKDAQDIFQFNSPSIFATPVRVKPNTITKHCRIQPFAYLPIQAWREFMTIGERPNPSAPSVNYTGLIGLKDEQLWTETLAFARLNLGIAEYSLHAGRINPASTEFPINAKSFDPFEL